MQKSPSKPGGGGEGHRSLNERADVMPRLIVQVVIPNLKLQDSKKNRPAKEQATMKNRIQYEF